MYRCAEIQSRRPLYMEELVIHVATLHRHRSAPCCTPSITFYPPVLQDRLCWLIVLKQPVGSSHSVLMIAPPVCPCLYLKLQGQIPMCTFFFVSRKIQIYFILLLLLLIIFIYYFIFFRSPVRAQKTKIQGNFSMERFYTGCCALLGGP